MPDDITGHCLCGASQFTATGPLRFALNCFCEDCRRATGSGYAPQIALDSSKVTFTGPIGKNFGTAASGNTLTFHFCTACGAQIAKSTSRMEDVIFLYAGVLDDPTIMPSNAQEVFTEDAPEWAFPRAR